MRSIKEIEKFEGKRILVRVDWNVPIQDAKVVDPERIDDSLETIKYLLEREGSLLILSHLSKEEESLRPAFEYFNNIIPAVFADDLNQIPKGKIVVLENIRKWPEEKENNENFSKKLANLCDIYINEAFSESHRQFASIVGIPKLLPSFAGILFLREYEALSKTLNPPHPFLLILGGGKFETKLPLVEKFLDIADTIFVGGAIAGKASEFGLSHNSKIIFPIGNIAALDANPETIGILTEKIEEAEFILWNGPLGKYESGYKEGTLKLAQVLADSGKEVIVGGGDTLAAIKELGIKNKFSFVSSAGGAMLDFLANGTLPGIEALN